MANLLAFITIFYNILEGLVSVFFRLEDETIALFGFGLDSFVEVISGVGIWHMIRRIRNSAMDSAGATVIAWMSYREGREAFGKAKGNSCSCSGCN